MKIADLRVQTTTPGTPSPNIVGVFADANNIVMTLVSGSTPIGIANNISGTVVATSVGTGMGVVQTGSWYGVTTNGAQPITGLAAPTTWLAFQQGGTQYAVPAYALV